jgi:predicted amino acid dehydrogenase
MPGADNVIVEARTALLDAITALEAHKASVILIGAQAIYLRTGNATFALAEATKDSDLAIDTRELGEDPLLEEAMTSAGFILNPVSQQPGAWMSPNGIPVDLMVPEHLAGSGSRAASASRPTPSTLHAGRPDWRPRSSTSHR